MLTPEQIQSARQRLGVTPPNPGVDTRKAVLQNAWNPPAPTFSEKHPILSGAYNLEKDVATGAAKGALSTIQGLGQAVLKGTDALGLTHDKGNSTFSEDPNALEPTSGAESFGKGAEQIGEFFIPGGAAMKGEKIVAEASKALPGIWGATARILGKSAVQATSAGGVRAAQTGGDVGEAEKAALGAGLARGAFAVIGEGARALHIPEKAYQMIFKNTKNDALHELNSEALIAWERSNPDEFKMMVDAGIVKVGKNGVPIVNKTLAEQALEKGLTGNVQTMANTVVKGAHKSEYAAQALAKAHPEKIDLSHGNYLKVLDDVAKEYEGVGFNEVSEEANNLASKLELSEGKVDAMTALQLRRFFDRLRVASSFDKPVSKLSMTQQNFKTLADSVRGEVNAIPGMKDIMENYSFYIDALDSLAQHAKRTGNNQLLSMIDSIFLGAGLGTGSAAPIFLGAARRAANIPALLTKGAQALKGGIMAPATSGAVNATIGAASAEPQ